ncbi:MAG: 2-oxoacid:acceptor oxidoreductase family protein [Candidatus Woesearchaeota archaeon]
MLELIIHGRGGQGAKTAFNILAKSSLISDKEVLAFPQYGPERTGAPMKSFLKVDDKKVRSYQPIEKADIVLVIDDSLFDFVDIESDLKDGGLLIVNTSNLDKIKEIVDVDDIYGIDATKIALDNVGLNKPNLPILGALVKVDSTFNLSNIVKTVREHFTVKIGKELTEKNVAAIQEAYMKTNVGDKNDK